MIEIKTDHGRTEGHVRGEMGELIADTLVIIHAVYLQIKDVADAEAAEDFYDRVVAGAIRGRMDIMQEGHSDEDEAEKPDT